MTAPADGGGGGEAEVGLPDGFSCCCGGVADLLRINASKYCARDLTLLAASSSLGLVLLEGGVLVLGLLLLACRGRGRKLVPER